MPASPGTVARSTAHPEPADKQHWGWTWAEKWEMPAASLCIPLPPYDPQGRLFSKWRKDARRQILFDFSERREEKSLKTVRLERSEILCSRTLPFNTASARSGMPPVSRQSWLGTSWEQCVR